MIGLRDNLILATTKLRVRRIRLIVTLIVSGLLFTVLVLTSLFIRGTLGSLNSFVGNGPLNRFLTAVMNPQDYRFTESKEYIARVEAIQKTRLDAQAAEAKRLGIPFDRATASAPTTDGADENGAKSKVVNPQHPVARQAFAELRPGMTMADLQALSANYHPKAIHTISTLSGYGFLNAPEFLPILNGKELSTNQGKINSGPPSGLESLSNGLAAADAGMIKPFLLENVSLDSKPGEPLPILAPADATAKLLGLKDLPAQATPRQRLDRLAELRQRAKNLTFDVCYRSSSAASARDEATRQAAEIAANSSTPNYQKPTLVYNAQTGDCQPTTIKSDTRSAEDKTLAAKLTQFNQTFGEPKPVTQRLTFRIVGLMPQSGDLAQAQDISGLIGSFFTASIGSGWYVYRPAALDHPILASIINDPYLKAAGMQNMFIDFPDRATQKRFLEDKACGPSEDPASCVKAHKVFAFAFGNPLATLYELEKPFNTGLRWVIIAIAVLSAIIMMGTIGKIIADSRKETSVFRAVGAKRLEIAQIYLLYTGTLASLAFLVALGLGAAIAIWADLTYSPSLSVNAVLAFNSPDLHKQFHLIGLNLLDLVKIYAFVLAVAFVSAILPLLTNLRRNPVKDMREE